MWKWKQLGDAFKKQPPLTLSIERTTLLPGDVIQVTAPEDVYKPGAIVVRNNRVYHITKLLRASAKSVTYEAKSDG